MIHTSRKPVVSLPSSTIFTFCKQFLHMLHYNHSIVQMTKINQFHKYILLLLCHSQKLDSLNTISELLQSLYLTGLLSTASSPTPLSFNTLSLSRSQFLSRLKTHLFSLSYPLNSQPSSPINGFQPVSSAPLVTRLSTREYTNTIGFMGLCKAFIYLLTLLYIYIYIYI